MSNHKFNIWVLLSFFISLIAVSIAVCLYATRPKIAFVSNDRILTEYKGVKEGQKIYQEKAQSLRSNLDTLGAEINKMVGKYTAEEKKMTEKDRKINQELIQNRQRDYFNYKKAVEQRIQEEDDKLTSSVMKQINTYVMDYAKEHGYDFVLGSNGTGSLFFAGDQYDITTEVIDALNKHYMGGTVNEQDNAHKK